MELDEEQYLGIGAYLFASVMRQFFSKYTSINSFVELLVRSQQREEPLGHWPPLAGTERVS
jgi:type VI secretion system protein ImpG